MKARVLAAAVLVGVLASCTPPSLTELRGRETVRRLVVIDPSGDILFSNRGTYRYDAGSRMYVLTMQDGQTVHVSDSAVIMAYDEVAQ